MRRGIVLIGLLVLASCEKSPSVPEAPVAELLTITPDTMSLRVFEEARLTARAFDASGAHVEDVDVAWSTSEPAVARIDPGSGVVEAVAPGEALITATAQHLHAAARIEVRVDVITFEVMPDGTAPCDRCPLTHEFSAWGLEFSFFSDAPADPVASLFRAGARHPGDPADNHMVTGAAVDGGGTWVGVIVMSFPARPDSVEFVLEGPHSVGGFPVRAYGPSGAPLPPGSVSVEASAVNRVGGFDFRRERLMIRGTAGVFRIEVDGRNKATGRAAGGFGLMIDDVSRWPDG
ncbi:MAG TPA: Ig-like domain-containing protein [Longimicrobiales bacterium]|nr:Ig-like domain-containing protein [Longimicrobiales bacterium]